MIVLFHSLLKKKVHMAAHSTRITQETWQCCPKKICELKMVHIMFLVLFATLCTTFEAHVTPTPTSKRAPFPRHGRITKQFSVDVEVSVLDLHKLVFFLTLFDPLRRPSCKDTLKGSFELGIAETVNDRVDGTVQVVDPDRDVVRELTDARFAEHSQWPQNGEWQPAEQEEGHDCAESFSSGKLLLESGFLHVAVSFLPQEARIASLDRRVNDVQVTVGLRGERADPPHAGPRRNESLDCGVTVRANAAGTGYSVERLDSVVVRCIRF